MGFEAVMMKNALVIVLAALAVIALSGASHAISGCSDGTAYFGCSTKSPGYLCVNGQLVNSVYNPGGKECPCTGGWVQQGEGTDATCVQANCNDGTQAGQCSITKPKQCINGVLTDNASACGCPSGMQMNANKVTCSSIPCNDSGVMVPNGLCSPQSSGKICQAGTLVDQASSCPCKAGTVQKGSACVVACSDGTQAGQCSSTKPKQCVVAGTGNGYLLDNASACGCPSGQTADGAICAASVANTPSGAADILSGAQPGNNSSSGTSVTGSANALSCCCLPTAMIGIAGGFVLFRKDGE